jgi:hypothetical protein
MAPLIENAAHGSITMILQTNNAIAIAITARNAAITVPLCSRDTKRLDV